MTASDRRRILVVEDEPVTRELLVGCLERAGYEVLQAEDGQAMRAAFDEAPLDLVLLDVELPAEDGFTLASFVRTLECGDCVRDTQVGCHRPRRWSRDRR